MNPSACPKWAGCSAPVCPLDPNNPRNTTRDGEPICHWLRQAVKPQGHPVPCELSESVREVADRLLSEGNAYERKSLLRAAASAPKSAPSRAPRGERGDIPVALVNSAANRPVTPQRTPGGTPCAHFS
jgi:hypothetical protein